MRNKSNCLQTASVVSSWASFKSMPNGSASEIRKSVAELRSHVTEERKIFSSASIFDGGTKVMSRK